ncbi:O-antigen ligase family protein [Bifidobacterium adolescentis]|uniref:O-antigen ligase family protein n=1 Tax=Bifidobacterium adolescentis TaxID=1680 RepID=UPI004062ACB1
MALMFQGFQGNGKSVCQQDDVCQHKLVTYAIVLMPYFILIANERSFTFQTALPSILLMMLAFVFFKDARRYTFHALIVMIGFTTIIGASNFLTVLKDDYLITSRTLIRAFMFMIIVWFYGTAISQKFSQKDILIILKGVSYSVLVPFYLEFKEYLKQGMYFGRVYPVTLRGCQLDANYFALLVLVQIVCSYIIAIYSARISDKILSWICILLGTVSIILTGSRSALMCMALIIVVSAFIYFIQKNNGKIKNLIFFVLCIAILFLVASKFMSGWMFDRFFNNSYHDDSNEQRVSYWINAIHRWPHRLFLGYGVGNYNYFFAKDRGLIGDPNVTTHGTITDFLVDFGIVGLFLFLYIIIDCVRILLKTHNYVLVAMLPGIIICSVIIGAERTVALWLWIIVFRILAEYLRKNPSQSLSDILA